MATQKSSRFAWLLPLFAAVTLFLAQSAYWVNHTVFDQGNFSHITTTALLSDSSRDAIAGSIVDRALEKRPVLKRTIGERATALISGLLGSDLSSQATTELSKRVYAYTTASNRQDIKIDLTGVKSKLAGLITLAQTDPDKAASIQQQIPDEIVLVESDAFPNLSGVVKTMLWLGPLFWLSTILLFGIYIYRSRADYARRVYIVLLVIIGVGLFGLVAMPFVPPPLAAAVPNIELRTVVENLANGFLAPFKSQMYIMIGGALAVLLIFNQRFNILSLLRTVETKASQTAKKASSK